MKRPNPPLTGPDPEAHSQIPAMRKINGGNVAPDPATEQELRALPTHPELTRATREGLARIQARKRAIEAGEIGLTDPHPWDRAPEPPDEEDQRSWNIEQAILQAESESGVPIVGRPGWSDAINLMPEAPATVFTPTPAPPLSRTGRWAVGVVLLSAAVIGLGPLVIVYWRWALG